MYIVKSPVEGYSGISAGVQFKDGVGKTDNKRAAEWLASKGYKVTEEKASKPANPDPPAEPPKEPEPPKAPEAPNEPKPPKGNTKGGKK
ncbi:MAG: hypothetical protein ACM3S4_04840 [Burkholderiales bacterium]